MEGAVRPCGRPATRSAGSDLSDLSDTSDIRVLRAGRICYSVRRGHAPPMKQAAIPPLSESPLVSVILSSYNYARYLPAALDSVFAQTWPRLELIAVDDGSSDDSRALLERARQTAPVPMRVILQEHRGQGAAWNAGFARAEGEVVCFLDSDDEWRPEKAAEMVAFMRAVPGGGVYQHQLDDGRGNACLGILRSGDLLAQWRACGRVNTALRHDLTVFHVPSSGLVFPRAVLEEIFPVPEAVVASPDSYVAWLGAALGPVCSWPKTLGTWRSHAENAGKSSRFSYRDYWVPVVLPEINRRFREWGVPVALEHRPAAVLLEPLRQLRDARVRRRRKAGGLPPFG